MTAVSVSVKKIDHETGARVVEATIVSDTAPAVLPTTGEGIVGLKPTDTFAPFSLLSLLYVTEDTDHKVFVADESGHFIPQ